MTQASLWQQSSLSANFSELCNALYERELCLLAQADIASAQAVQAKLKSLPYYIQRVARAMTQACGQTKTPLSLDSQNASWSAKQSSHMPLVGQEREQINIWYNSIDLSLGLVLPIALESRIVLDCIDRLDSKNLRFRTNVHGWFSIADTANVKAKASLLKANKKVMLAACCGHSWQGQSKEQQKCIPIIPSLRELLLSCAINWQNLKKSV